MNKERYGIFMPVTSLPSDPQYKMGIGSIGTEAYRFVDWLVEAKQHFWQILPTTYPDGHSPYTAFSAFAGNPLLISLVELWKEGLISKLPTIDQHNSRIDYDWVETNHYAALREAFENAPLVLLNNVKLFKERNSWVNDFALFMAYRDHNSKKPLWEMDYDLRMRKENAMNKYRNLLSNDIEFHVFVQYLFFKQWSRLKKYAHDHNVEIIGDMPIYVSLNSSDVWSNPELFMLDENFNPTGVAGCPPDAYSEVGQLWGNPLYNWDNHKKEGYKWWIERVRHSFVIGDVLRIDHFRAFDRYYVIEADAENAKNGTWKDGPKTDFFDALKSSVPNARIIAEDLGIIDDSVRELMRKTGYPGMKVMIFGLTEDNEHTPRNWPPNYIGYTSTHDSEPIKAAFEKMSMEEHARAENLLGFDTYSETVSISAIRAAYASKAKIVIVPIQDALSLGEKSRINTPGVVEGSWEWRACPDMLSHGAAKTLSNLVSEFE